MSKTRFEAALAEMPRGALVELLHTLMVDTMPQMEGMVRNEIAHRLWLLDEMQGKHGLPDTGVKEQDQ